MANDLVDDGYEVVQSMINDGNIAPEDRLAGLVLFAAFEYGPRAGVIARRLDADVAAVGEIVENLDTGQYWGSFESGRERGIHAEWPEMLATAQPDDEMVTRCIISFILDVMVATGRLTRQVDEAGGITYRKRAELTPAAEAPVEASKSCTRCGTVKSLSEFHRRRDRGTYFSQCKRCMSGRQKDWRQRVVEHENPRCAECGGLRGYGSFAADGKCQACYRRPKG